MSFLDYDEELIGEAPCEFCGDSYPLYLLIEHQTTHLNEDQYYLEDVNFPEVVVNERPINEPKKSEELTQMLAYMSESKEVIPAPKPPNQMSDPKPDVKSSAIHAQPLKTSNSTVGTKPDVKSSAIHAQPLKTSNSTVGTKVNSTAGNITNSTVGTKKNLQKNYQSEIEEFTTEKGEKLLVYGANIDPVEDLENEKSSYQKPNNPLLNTITKEADVIDINSLSDDDSEESLEEFWKRARDFLKRNRGKI